MGVPLAGYNHGERRVPHWPLVEETKYTTVSCAAYLKPTYRGTVTTVYTSITIYTARTEPCIMIQ